MVKLYLDIDGVLLQKDQSLPEGLAAFLAFALAHFDCYWLTTHCKGDAQTALRYLSRYYPADLLRLLSPVKASNWDALKTDAIDFSQPFFWLDDYAMEAEKRVLEAHSCRDRLISVDLKHPKELFNIKGLLIASLKG